MNKSDLKVGDFVRYRSTGNLCNEFISEWGLGPFEVVESYSQQIHCKSIDGRRVVNTLGSMWNFSTDNLILDVFLGSVKKAITYEDQV